MDAFEADFAAWAADQARSLREGDWAAVDLPHLIGALEGLADNELAGLHAEIRQILELMLMDEYAPMAPDGEPLALLAGLRRRARERLNRSPSLWARLHADLPALYSQARLVAADTLGADDEEFPATLCYDMEAILPRTGPLRWAESA